MIRRHQLFLFNLRLFTGTLIAKLIVFWQGLRTNCLLTRYPIVWVQPTLKECIHLARLREHGFQISASYQYPMHQTSNEHILTRPPQKFDQLLDSVINLAEKDLLEL